MLYRVTLSVKVSPRLECIHQFRFKPVQWPTSQMTTSTQSDLKSPVLSTEEVPNHLESSRQGVCVGGGGALDKTASHTTPIPLPSLISTLVSSYIQIQNTAAPTQHRLIDEVSNTAYTEPTIMALIIRHTSISKFVSASRSLLRSFASLTATGRSITDCNNDSNLWKWLGPPVSVSLS